MFFALRPSLENFQQLPAPARRITTAQGLSGGAGNAEEELMGLVKLPKPVLLVSAVFSRYPEALDWAAGRLAEAWGPVALASPRFDFSSTQFYEKTMGPGLLKQFLAFETLIDPATLVECKLAANQWEEAYAAERSALEPRPLNIDPGYLTEAKFVLATTKDRDHRLYLNRGIYAELTLYWQAHRWQCREWTYPDYRRDDYHLFLTECRDYLRRRYQAGG